MRIDVAACVKKELIFFLIGALIMTSWSCTESKKTTKSDTPTAIPGLATVTSVVTQAITPPSIRDTVDALESAIIAIRLSNTVLLHTPLSEDCRWPADFSKAPSQDTLVKMGISGAVMSQGGSAAFERDPRTGLPRPTSPFYLLLKEKEALLKRTKRPRRNGHKNALRAFGVVSLNNKEVEELERALVAYEKGAKKCQGLIGSNNRMFKQGIKEKYCENRALKVVKLDGQWEAKKMERDDAKKQFAPLAKNVLRVTLANLDYLGAALTQMTGTILKMSSAINNAKNEFCRLPPREVTMMVSRLENIKQIAPFFPNYMSDQIKIYKTIYSVLKEDYDDLLDESEKKAAQHILNKVRVVEIAHAGIREKIEALARGDDVQFTAGEQAVWSRLATLYSSDCEYAKQNECNLNRMTIITLKAEKDLFARKEMRP